MATHRRLPADFAEALDRYPPARERFLAMPAPRQEEWLVWIDRARGQRGRATRIDEALRRLSPHATAAEEEVVEPVAPPPERGWWLWLLLLLLVVVAGLLLWFFLSRGPGKTIVPNVIGQRAPDAAAQLHAAHLKDLPTTAPSSKPSGVVFAQQPGAGVRVNKNHTVTIFISSGLAGTAVPNVTDVPEQQALEMLTAAGFTPKIQRHASTRPKGVVVAQQPVAGVTAVKGTTVNLTVSTGVRPVTVPSLVGQTQGAAVNQLTRLGLKPQLKNVPAAQPAGRVVTQKPAPGARVDKGSTVTLNVSSGAGTTTVQTTTTATPTTGTTAPVTVPRLTGVQQTPALRRLNDLRFRPVVRYVASSQPAGTITSQRPAAGTSAARESRVFLTVSEGPSPNPAQSVPDVVGQDQASAVSTLRSAGFRVLVLQRPTTDQSQLGLVIDEQPASDSSIPSGSQVTIFVGRLSG